MRKSRKINLKSRRRQKNKTIKNMRGGGIFDFLFKGANTFVSDPLKVKRTGRHADLLDFLVNLESSKGEWRRLKRNLAKLSVYDLTVPTEKQAYVDELIKRLESRGIKLKAATVVE